jgi:hypothetical protein
LQETVLKMTREVKLLKEMPPPERRAVPAAPEAAAGMKN